ncbi:MAG TPA: glycosyltransferase [Clostridia bacterium]|nr:glycosyltransferase [Clostridia bacterium]
MSSKTAISVVIVTRNRPGELACIALPSLAHQTSSPAQVLVWDASDDMATQGVVTSMQPLPGTSLQYVRAPRQGTPSQRNDAVSQCIGDVILFLDDDTELWPDALRQLALVFDADTGRRIAGCQCTLVAGPRWKNRTSGVRWLLAHLYRSVFLLDTLSRRQGFLPSGHTTGAEPLPEVKAVAQAAQGGCERGLQWMWGNCMAWRRSIFATPGARFDEELQATGSYGFLEDTMFSRQVLRLTGMELVRARAALCMHHEAGGGRADPRRFGAMYAFNYWLLWRRQVRHTPASTLAFLWSQCGLLVGFAARDILSGRFERVRGLIDGWNLIRNRAGRPEGP